MKIAQLVECNLAKVKVVGSIPVFHFTNLKFITMFYFVLTLLELLVVIVPLLISVAYFTLAERKIMGAMQRRKGPNVIGVFGLLQPLADGLKLFAKKQFYQQRLTPASFY